MNKLIITIAALVPKVNLGNAIFHLIIAITLITASSAHSQNTLLQSNNKPSPDFMSRFAIEGGVNITYPIQNLAEYTTSGSFNFTGSIYAKIVNNVSVYLNYSYLDIDVILKKGPDGEYIIPPVGTLLGNFKNFNIGGNYSFEYKNHFPFIEGGIGLYNLNTGQGPTLSNPNPTETETQFGVNLGAGYRYMFVKHIGLFVKGKLHSFSYESRNWSLWNFSGGIFVKL